MHNHSISREPAKSCPVCDCEIPRERVICTDCMEIRQEHAGRAMAVLLDRVDWQLLQNEAELNKTLDWVSAVAIRAADSLLRASIAPAQAK